MNCSRLFCRSFSKQTDIVPKISVIGSGPAGFYCAQYLLKKLKNCEIDIYERLPVPFGLVRFGVAPDHPEVKNVENTFTKVGEHKNVRFVGNVNVGQDISLKELREAYHVVILAYGAEENKSLNIKGETLKNVLSARRVVGWYNGLPWDKHIPIDLSGETVAIFGQGNVAIDVARILLKPVDDLKRTDITQHSLEILAKSKINTVYLIGRRGPLQASFTIKEMREMLRLKDCHTDWKLEDFGNISNLVETLPRPKKRLTELMLKSAIEKSSENFTKKFKPIFLRTPLELIGETELKAVKLGVNGLEGSNIFEQKAVLTHSSEVLDCHLAVVSIGYKSVPLEEGLNFDHNLGCVKNHHGKISTGLYATGWVATGPAGVILTTMNSSFSVADQILSDFQKEGSTQEVRQGYEYVEKHLNQRNIQIVNWKDWIKIDEFEIAEGKKSNKPREKIVDVNQMLKIAAS